MSVIAQVFVPRRGVAMGIALTGSSTGSSSFTGENSENSYKLIVVLSAGSCLGRIIPGIAAELVGPFNVILIMTALALVSSTSSHEEPYLDAAYPCGRRFEQKNFEGSSGLYIGRSL